MHTCLKMWDWETPGGTDSCKSGIGRKEGGLLAKGSHLTKPPEILDKGRDTVRRGELNACGDFNRKSGLEPLRFIDFCAMKVLCLLGDWMAAGQYECFSYEQRAVTVYEKERVFCLEKFGDQVSHWKNRICT